MNQGDDIATVVGRNWWILALRGVVAVLFGVVAFVWPEITLSVLVLLFAAYALADGIFAFIGAFRAAEDRHTAWPFLIEGIVSVAAGIVAFVWPALTVVVLLYLIAAWAIVTGIFELYAAVRFRRRIDDEWWLGLSGITSVIFGVLLVLLPGPGAIALLWLIAAYAIVFGVLLLALALRLRRWRTNARSPVESETAT